MIPHSFKPLLLLTSLLTVAASPLGAQEPKPAVAEAKPVPAQARPESGPTKPASTKPTSKPATQGSKSAAQDAKAPVKKAKPAAKKAVPPAPNYNLNEPPSANPAPKPPRPKYGTKPKSTKIPYDKRLNLNAATKAELMKLPGVTEEYAAKIIAGRPYTSTTGLVLNHVLPTTVYYLIKDQVAAGKVPSK